MPKCRPGFFSFSPLASTTTNPFLSLDIHHRIPFPPLFSFYFLLKSLLRGLHAFDPLTQWCSMMTKVVWVFILTSLAWNEISQKPEKEEGGEKINSGLFGSKNIHHDSTYDNLILSHPHLDMHSRKKQPLQGWLLLANILASQLASLLTYKKSGTWWWWWWLLYIVLYFF